MCPAIANLVCLRDVGGVPFEYPTLIRRDPTTGLVVVGRRQTPRTQRFIPAVRDALLSFTAMMAQFRMPIEAILTAGSLYCRCIRGTNTLSNHSFGDAIDIVGVRWPPVGGPPSRLRETIVHNWADPGERALLRRMNAVLRLSFTTVIDYHRPDHRDHFHCDMNRGQARRPRSRNNLTFVQEALGVVLGRAIPVTARWDAATQRALSEFSGASATALEQDDNLNRILGALFARVAAGR